MLKVKKHIAILMFVLINAVFVDKYGARVIEWHAWVSCAYALTAIGIVGILLRLVDKLRHPGSWLIAATLLTLGAGIGLQYAIDPMSIQVDRWSAIHNFLQGMLKGEYPYGQQTHLGGYGSPLPIWQILHLPFYAVGNVGLSIFVVLGLLVYTLYNTRGKRPTLIAVCMLMISPALWYEIAVRSDLITNIMLVTVIAEWLAYKKVTLHDKTVRISVLCGLLLSTRLVAIIPIAVLYGYEFVKMGWKKQILIVSTTLGTFGATLLPFILWKGSTLLFFEYNPFVLQTRQGSWWVLVLWTIIAIGWTIHRKDQEDLRVLNTGGLLTLLVVMAFIGKMWTDGAWGELYSSTFDITYLSLGLPFYVLEVMRQGGKKAK
jgi:hypothetical protein